MKILMLTPYLPYPTNSGGQIRSNNLIKHLSKKHEITLCSLIKHDNERKYVSKLEPYCKKIYLFKRAENPWSLKNIINTGLSLHPFVVIRNFSADEKKAVSKLLKEEKFDIIHAETFYVYPHIPKTEVPVVLVDQTIEYKVYEHYVKNYKFPPLKPLLYIDVLKIKFWESYYWKKAAQVVAVSEKDAEVMRQTVKGLKVVINPNGVGDDLADDVPLHFNKTILFMGNYAWLQNSEAAIILARKIFPIIKSKVTDAKLIIAGQFTGKIKELATEDIKVLDFEIDDIKSVQKYFRSSGVLVAPLYGPGGSRLKILSAMAARLPVVTTDIGIEGIEAVNGKSVLFGKTSEELASLAINLLQDKFFYKKIANNARKLVEEKYTYDAIAESLSQIYESLKKA